MTQFLSNTFVTNYLQQGPQVLASNSVATQAQVSRVLELWEPELSGTEQDYAFAFVMACRDQGSSRFTVLGGSADGNNFPFDTAARIVKQICTLRQFCMFYAPAIWNYSVQQKNPPANWVRAGYTDDNYYAAFDFFNGVLHPAALQVPGGLVRRPTASEIKANKINGASAIMAHREEDQHTTREQASFQRQVSATPTRPAIGWN